MFLAEGEYRVFGNWKGNMGTPELVRPWLDILDAKMEAIPLRPNIKLVIFAPHGMLRDLDEGIRSRKGLQSARRRGVLHYGVQSVSPFGPGDHTGWELADSAHALGATHALIGHSEQRHAFPFVTNEIISRQIEQAQQSGLRPVLCIGETLDELEAGKTDHVLRSQLDVLSRIQWNGDVVYEPVWAIGGGRPTPKIEAIRSVRDKIRDITQELGKLTPIIGYGGSVSLKNANEIVPVVNAVLPGTASRNADEWYGIARIASDLV